MTNTLSLSVQVDRRDEIDYVLCCLDIDGQPLEECRRYLLAIDLEELFRSERESGVFSIITCWCGVPECAGIRNGVGVRHDAGWVYWRLSSPAPERHYAFRQADYSQALADARRAIKRFVAQRRYSGEGPYELAAQYANEGYFRLGDEW
ncbi:hypothetical protein CCAX7_38410 [Capsulimonas corticalis]|uniref:Uncharacterized protein n=1 Tax=Capsulimonas corticalis TaxID=2219043 RepID=A0A402D6T8_9BACT|nr:hypothetical protein [Capsulimonas corticalis]BDI31790.1 hypothetical protein CCAX7_38410 [Capsulimonas corticalis]